MKRADVASEFEGWLDRELRAAVETEVRGAVPASRPAYRRLGHAGRRAGLSLRAGVVLVGLGLTLAGGGVAMAAGRSNPLAWGQTVVVGTLRGLPDGSSPAAQPRPVPGMPGAPTAPAPGPSARPGDGHAAKAQGQQDPQGEGQHDPQGAGQGQQQEATPAPTAKSHGSDHATPPGHQKTP